jgi:hypothetical protein
LFMPPWDAWGGMVPACHATSGVQPQGVAGHTQKRILQAHINAALS